ncbi:MAG: hemerythrin domain-containing protein [Georgenia sp.]
MTRTLQPADLTGAVEAHHSTLESELIRRTESLLGAVGARAAHEPAQQDLVSFVCLEILPHVQAEQELLYDPAPDAPTALLGRAMRAQHRQLAAFAAEVEHARTGMDAAAAASALVALFMARAEVENTVLLPALAAAGTDLPTLLAHQPEITGEDEPTAEFGSTAGLGSTAAPGPTAGPGVSGLARDAEPRVLDLNGLDYPDCRERLRATIGALEPGRECTILSGPELVSLRYELEATLPRGFRWSMPTGTPGRFATVVRRD